MNLRTLAFLVWKDLTRDPRVLLLVILAVGSGSLAIVPLRGLLEGLTQNLISTTIDASTGHLILTPLEDRSFLRNVGDMRVAVEELPAVVGMSVRLEDRALVVHKGKSHSAVVVGLDPRMESRTTSIADKLVEGSFLDDASTNGVVIGKEVADELQVRESDWVGIVFGNGARQTVRVTGIFSTGVRQVDGQILVGLRRLRSVLQAEGQASEIVVRLSDIGLSDLYRSRVQRMGLEARVQTWRERLEFVEGMRRSYRFIQNFLVLLTLVAAGIATGVLIYTDIQHKRRAIGILKAIGASDRGVLALFLTQGLVIGVAGAAVGGLLGGSICYYLSQHPVSIGVSVSSLPLRAAFVPSLLLLPTVLILLTAVVSAAYPAWRASRLVIVEAIWSS